MDNLLSAFYATKRVDAVLSPMTGFRSASCRRSRCRLWQRQHADADRQRAGCGSSSIKSMLRASSISTIFKDTRDLAKVTADMVDAALSGKTVTVNDTTTYKNGVRWFRPICSSRW